MAATSINTRYFVLLLSMPILPIRTTMKTQTHTDTYTHTHTHTHMDTHKEKPP